MAGPVAISELEQLTDPTAKADSVIPLAQIRDRRARR